MADDILTGTLEQAVDRRSFLRGSGRFAAALGMGLAAPLAALAQEPPQQKPKTDEKKKDGEEKKDTKKDEKDEGRKEDEKKDDPLAEEDSRPQTMVDQDGREYRSCPECGANMYKQGRTWTCENCGYSYVE